MTRAAQAHDSREAAHPPHLITLEIKLQITVTADGVVSMTPAETSRIVAR